jgi:hypothetical protein
MIVANKFHEYTLKVIIPVTCLYILRLYMTSRLKIKNWFQSQKKSNKMSITFF